MDEFVFACEGDEPLLFTENETNNERLFPEYPNAGPYVKDGINDWVVQGRQDAVNPGITGHQGRGALPGQRRRRSDQGDSLAALQELSEPAGENLWQTI
jgi:hypothetical protein